MLQDDLVLQVAVRGRLLTSPKVSPIGMVDDTIATSAKNSRFSTRNNTPSPRENRKDSLQRVMVSVAGVVAFSPLQYNSTDVTFARPEARRANIFTENRAGSERYRYIQAKTAQELTNVWATGSCVHCHRLWNSIGVMPTSAHASTSTCGNPLRGERVNGFA